MDPAGDAAAPPVAPSLHPTRSFDRACEMVLGYLEHVVPMGLWAVTRVADGRQTFLQVRTDEEGIRSGYGVIGSGTALDFDGTMCESMVAGTAPQIAPDVSVVPEYAARTAGAPLPVCAYVGMPIVRPDGQLFGTVCGCSPLPQSDALLEHQPLLALLSSLLSSVLEADTAATATERELERVRQEADTDVLTGLLNRRGWERLLALEEERYRRFGDPACVVVLDLDRLKAVNDTQGHDAGDRYIRQAADSLNAVVRAGDLVARLGGDEFGVIAHGVGPGQSTELVGRMEQALAGAGVAGTFGHAPYTVVTGFPGAWKLADQAMYERKHAHRAGPDVRLWPLDEAMLPLLLEVAVADADPLEVMPPVPGRPGWTAERREAFREFHRSRSIGTPRPVETTYVVAVDGRAAGAARLEPSGDDVEIGVWIGRSLRGTGVGRIVTAELLVLARTAGARRLVASTTADNDAAQRLLRGIGAHLERDADEVRAAVPFV